MATVKFPKYLSVGNWLFQHIEADSFAQNDGPVGGPIPENLYIVHGDWGFNFCKHLRTYEGLIAYGATEPDDKELLRLVKH